MIDNTFLPTKRNLPQKVIQKYIDEFDTKALIVILNSFDDASLPHEELILKRKFIKMDKLLKSPLLPLPKGFPKHIAEYIFSLKNKLCLDDKVDVAQIWAVDVYSLFKTIQEQLINSQHLGITSQEIKNIKDDFAGLALKYNIYSRQTSLKKTNPDIIKNLVARYRDNFILLHKMVDKIGSFIVKVSHACKTADHQSCSINIPILKNQFIEIHIKAGIVEKLLNELLLNLQIGISLYGHTHHYKYLHEIEFGCLVSKLETVNLDNENISKINQFLKISKKSWEVVGTRKLVGLAPPYMRNTAEFLPVEMWKQFDNKNIVRIGQDLKKNLFELQSTYEQIAKLYFRSIANKISWQEVQVEWNKIDKTSPMNSDLDNLDLRCPIEWLSEAVSCFSVANTQLMTVHRMYENVICKNKIPDYSSFDELCHRLTNNFKSIFKIEKNDLPILVSDDSKEPLDILIMEFSSDLLEINRQFKAKINAQLPSRETIDYCIFKFSLLKDSLISNETLLPFRPAVIFVATNILPAIKKAHRWLFKRFKDSLEQIGAKKVEEKKKFLIKRLEGLCFAKMKPLLELLITIRDIQAVLLDQKECSVEMEKGLHLIPVEFANLLNPKEISELIDLYIKTGADPISKIDENVEMDFSKEVIIEINFDELEEELIPALKNISIQTTNNILETLNDSRSFKIQRQEKLTKILRRLKELGAYFLREAKGSHSIWAHPNTDVTFTMVNGDELSIGVSKKLEEWVNNDIFKNSSLEPSTI